MVDEYDIVDTIAKHFYPDKDGPSNYLPIETIGDMETVGTEHWDMFI